MSGSPLDRADPATPFVPAKGAEDDEERCDVLILGAGAAGIAAARLLLRSDLALDADGSDDGNGGRRNVVVLEARDRVGGRTHTSNALGVGVSLDHGGKWIHGACPENPMTNALKEIDGAKEECEEETLRRRERRGITRLLLPARDTDGGGEGRVRAVDPSKGGLRVAGMVLKIIQKLSDDSGNLEHDVTVEELLYRTHEDCIPPDSAHDEEGPSSICQRQFYYNLIEKVLSTSAAKFDDGSQQLRDEVMAILNMKLCRIFEGYEGAPIHRLSAKHGMDGSELPGGDWHVPFGYGELFRRLSLPVVDDGVIRMGHEVISVETASLGGNGGDGDGDGATVRVTVRCMVNGRAKEEKVYRSSACVVTLPLGVLRGGLGSDGEGRRATLFRPPLPAAVTEAIETLGVAIMNKVELSFPTRWWPENTGFVTIGSSLPERSPTYHPFSMFLVESETTADQPDAPNVLVCYLTGEFASLAEDWDDDVVRARCMKVLRDADFPSVEDFAPDVPDPDRVHVTRWRGDPYSCGSWTFFAKDSGLHSVTAFTKDEECSRRGLFFAGEHTCDGSCPGLDIGCAHGAWLSGELAAQRVLKVLRSWREQT